jgi:hypothetical protein
MFNKKKIIFWRMAFIYGGITIISLFLLWNSPSMVQSKMMASSMGNTMKSMHLSNTTIYGLFSGENMSNQMASMASHTGKLDSMKYNVGFYGTSIIYLLLPFIIGGTIILGIVWFK